VLGPLSVLAAAACLATPVSADRSRIHVGPFTGYLAAGYDDVDGRFSLRVGGMRTKAGLSSKIPWWLPMSYRDVGELVVTGRLIGARGHFTQTFPEAMFSETPDSHVYPSIIDPPKTGCWRLTFKAGAVKATVVMLARPRPSG
jgi:hypothetical protein